MRIILIFLCIFLSGCLIRTYTIQKPRVDLDIKGNQGYIVGSPSPEKKEPKLGDKRTMTVVEIELGPHKPLEFKEEESKVMQKEMPSQEEVVEEKDTTKEKRYEYYIVQKNDTLQKISYKFYGTTKKWKKLYKENEDVLKDPNKIYPGIKIKIPIE